MSRHSVSAALLLLFPASALGQSTPEDLLPASNQIYFRWDGIEKHRASYAKTALGKILQGDMGKFLASAEAELHRFVGTAQVSDKLLQGVAPERLKKVLADADEIPKLLSLLGQKGFLVAAEVRRISPPDIQVTLIIPEGASALPVMRGLGQLVGAEIKEVNLDQSTVLHVPLGSIHLCAWADQSHAIVTIGSDNPKAALGRTRGKEARLSSHPLFARLASLRQVETSSRGFVDLARLVPLARSTAKQAASLLTGLGVEGMKSMTFYAAFSGDATRSVVELESDGQRGGLNGLFSGKPFRPADLPAIPPDVSSWSSSSLDATGAYDFLFRALELAARITAPDQVAEVLRLPKEINDALGIDFRNDLLAALDDRIVVYNSPSEGTFFLGLTLLVKVKDGAKVRKGLETAIKSLGRITGLDARVQKRAYRGGELREVIVRQQGFFPVPTYTIYKDWLVLGLFPQSVKGFILRTEGELPVWQPEPRVKAILDKLPERVTSVSVSDPRPGVTQLLTFAPPLLGLLRSFSPGSVLDVGTSPNANEITRHLFPNVSVTTYEGKIYGTESIHSLGIPFDLISTDRLVTLYFAASLFGLSSLSSL